MKSHEQRTDPEQVEPAELREAPGGNTRPLDRAPSLARSSGLTARTVRANARAAERPRPGDELTESRVAEIRLRVRSGAYDDAGIVEEVARRLLRRGAFDPMDD